MGTLGLSHRLCSYDVKHCTLFSLQNHPWHVHRCQFLKCDKWSGLRGIPRRWWSGKPGLINLEERGKPVNKVALWLFLGKRIKTKGSPLIRFTTTSDITCPGFPLNHLFGLPQGQLCQNKFLNEPKICKTKWIVNQHKSDSCHLAYLKIDVMSNGDVKLDLIT